MTPKQQIYHKSLVKALHISRRYKEYYSNNKDEYKELLQEHYGVDSSKELTIDQLIIFVDYMNFKRDELPKYEANGEELCTKKQLSTMKGLWESFASIPTEAALLKFANRQTGKTYLHLHMISKTEAQKIIPVLKTMKNNIFICK
jgi:hypothetical protein